MVGKFLASVIDEGRPILLCMEYMRPDPANDLTRIDDGLVFDQSVLV